MRPEHAASRTLPTDRRAASVVLRLTGRRAARSGTAWALVFGIYVAGSVTNYTTIAKTPAQREKLAFSLGTNVGLHAMFGTARRIDTVAGFTAWRSLGVLAVVGAIWAVLLATRLTRGEEDAGRWEILLTGQTTRRGAATQALGGLAAGLVSLWAVTALLCLGVGGTSRARFTASGSLFLSLALVASPAMFLALGAVSAQLAPSRKQANGIGTALFGATYLLRMVADSGSGVAWLRWTSPLGWVEELHPLTGSRPFSFVPIAGLTLVAAGAAAWLGGRRDLGGSALPAHDVAPARTGLLQGQVGLSVRLARPLIVSWAAGMAVVGLVGGLVAQSASSAVSGSATVQRVMARLGAERGGAAVYLGVFFVIGAAVLALAAAGQVASIRTEEADGRVDHLFARPVGRGQWMVGRLGVAAVLVVAAALATGAAAWVGAATQNSGLGLDELTQAGINLIPPALFILGLGAVAYGLAPRVAPGLSYAVVVWSLLVQLIGAGVRMNHWLLDTSLLVHIRPAPAANPNWVEAAILTGLGVAGALAGVIAFDRRDLASG